MSVYIGQFIHDSRDVWYIDVRVVWFRKTHMHKRIATEANKFHRTRVPNAHFSYFSLVFFEILR